MMVINENSFFREATVRICGSLDIIVAMENCFTYLKDYVPVDELSLDLIDYDLNTLHIIAWVTSEGGKYLNRIQPLPERDGDDNVRMFHAQDILIVNRPDSLPYLRKVFEKHDRSLEASVMFVKLNLAQNRYATLRLIANGVDRYHDEHSQLLSLLREPFTIAMANAMKHEEVIKTRDILEDDNRYLHQQLLELSGTEIIGAQTGLKTVMSMVKQVAPLDSPVLILGETGVGKEVIARAIHHSSPRRDAPFIKVNCGAIPENLLESELFGHEKGAFTGAITQKKGRFERAHKGTIFLDEIGELSPGAQVRLLHVLQSGEIERVGGVRSVRVDARIISATNRNLEQMILAAAFRKDLWYRLNVFPIMIPPLRLRKEDIPALVSHFVQQKNKIIRGAPSPRLAPDALDDLMAYDWPGNIRELENVVERALIQHRGGLLSFHHSFSLRKMNTTPVQYDEPTPPEILKLNDMLARHIRQALKYTRGKIHGPGGAAELLDINPSTLRKRMDKLGVPYKRRT